MFVKLGSPGRKNKAETIVIHDYDTWNIDVTLAHIIVPMLKQLKEKKHGAPFVDNEDVPENLRVSKEEEEDVADGGTDEHYFERWDYVLDQMIWAFQEKLEDWEEKFYSGETDTKFVKIKEIVGRNKDNKGEELYEMVNGPNHTFEVDTKGMKKHSDKIDSGIMLFAKYYSGLWD